MVTTDGNGTTAFLYTGTVTGVDSVVASASGYGGYGVERGACDVDSAGDAADDERGDGDGFSRRMRRECSIRR